MNSQVMDHSSDKPHVSDDAKLATQPNAPEDTENYDDVDPSVTQAILEK